MKITENMIIMIPVENFKDSQFVMNYFKDRIEKN